MIMGPDGVFYGTIGYGGATPGWPGAIFELTPSAGGSYTETILYNFKAREDGSTPNSLTLAPNGQLYGTTFGTSLDDGYHTQYGIGTAFILTPPASQGEFWTKTTLAQLSAGDLRGPDSPLIWRNGNLYGVSSSSAYPYGGVIYELQPPAGTGGNWTTTILYGFNDLTPGGPLVMDQEGTIYGTAVGPQNEVPAGIVYRIEAP